MFANTTLLYAGSNTILVFLNYGIGYRYQLLEKLANSTNILELEKINLEIVRIEEMLSDLVQIYLVSESKPLLAKYRPDDWFLVNKDAICLVGRFFIKVDILEINLENKELVLDYNTEIMGTRQTKLPINSPLIMLPWEHKYFNKNPEFAEFWIKNSGNKELAENFLNAL